VVLDLGGGVGALVLRTPAALVGTEIEISPAGEPGRRRHVAVHPRPLPTGTVHAAVYGDLFAGDWQLWAAADVPAMTVRVEDGRVTVADWPPPG
jgi:hypothetical protein